MARPYIHIIGAGMERADVTGIVAATPVDVGSIAFQIDGGDEGQRAQVGGLLGQAAPDAEAPELIFWQDTESAIVTAVNVARVVMNELVVGAQDGVGAPTAYLIGNTTNEQLGLYAAYDLSVAALHSGIRSRYTLPTLRAMATSMAVTNSQTRLASSTRLQRQIAALADVASSDGGERPLVVVCHNDTFFGTEPLRGQGYTVRYTGLWRGHSAQADLETQRLQHEKNIARLPADEANRLLLREMMAYVFECIELERPGSPSPLDQYEVPPPRRPDIDKVLADLDRAAVVSHLQAIEEIVRSEDQPGIQVAFPSGGLSDYLSQLFRALYKP